MSGLEAELKERLPVWPSDDLAYAPAPHTLYTLHLEVAKMILEECRRRGRRTSLHLLEHAMERRAIERGEGPVVEWLPKRSRIDPSELAWPKKPVLDVAEELGALADDVLLVHLTEARPDELARYVRRSRLPTLVDAEQFRRVMVWQFTLSIMLFTLAGNGGPTGADHGGFFPSTAFGRLTSTSGGLLASRVNIAAAGMACPNEMVAVLTRPWQRGQRGALPSRSNSARTVSSS